MIARLLVWNNGAGQAEARIASGGPLVDSRGYLDRSALVELVAQAYAAGKGWEGRCRGQTVPRPGYLVGIRTFTWRAQARTGDHLRITVSTEGAFGDFRVVSGRVRRLDDDLELGRGELRLWRAPADARDPTPGKSA
jgi:predicted hotdog family 3-hydroxylacyl-ACP dehydratase